MNELERFISLFNQAVIHTFDYLDLVKPEQWGAIPCDSDALFLGTRINKITVGALTRHLMNAESHWFGQIAPLAAGATMPLPSAPVSPQEAEDGTWLIEAYRTAHKGNLDKIQALTPVVLEKEIFFTGRRYTGIGFLWSVLGHHAYHLGQIDLLMRQQGIVAPEYMEWPKTGELLG